jgi:hypothetical protein
VTSSAFTIAVTGAGQALNTNHGSGFTNLGGVLIGAPAVVSLPINGSTTDLYIVTGTDHNLYERTDTLGWQILAGGPCLDNPAAVVSGSTLMVACTRSTGIYYGTTSIPASGMPTIGGFTAFSGASNYGPAIAVVNGVPTVFVTGTDNRLYWRTSSQWWVAFSGVSCTGHPAAASAGTTSYVACHNSSDNALWQATNTGSGWGTFTSLAGVLIDGPGIAATSAGPVYTVEGTDKAVYQNVGGTWQWVGGYILFGPGATADP